MGNSLTAEIPETFKHYFRLEKKKKTMGNSDINDEQLDHGEGSLDGITLASSTIVWAMYTHQPLTVCIPW